MFENLWMGALLLGIMLLLLAGGVWIAMTLAIVGWVGQASSSSVTRTKSPWRNAWAIAKKAAAAHSHATTSLSPLTCQFICRPTPATIISTKIRNTQNAPSAPAPS